MQRHILRHTQNPIKCTKLETIIYKQNTYKNAKSNMRQKSFKDTVELVNFVLAVYCWAWSPPLSVVYVHR